MWRRLSRLQKTLFTLLGYLMAYLVLSFALSPEATVSFVSEEFRIGDKYALMFLVAPQWPVFTDSEGAAVFTTRRCGRCFLTNNKGFLPMREYDAVLVLGDRSLLSQTAAVMDPAKRYLIEADGRCVSDRLQGCEPKITSFSTRETYDLCGLCESIVGLRQTT